jgi:2-methylisocitrate lyase-like PEP mutase family enzyme
VPVTADIESGYGLQPEEIARRLLEAGAVGCNLEDTDHAAGKTLRDATTQAHRLQAFKQAANAAGVDVVLNARTDVFLRLKPNEPQPIEEAIRRGRLYLEAGADCIYPIGVADEGAIAALVDGIPGPINVIPGFRGAPGLARLRELGVRRMSYAARLYNAAMADHQRRLAAIQAGQDF